MAAVPAPPKSKPRFKRLGVACFEGNWDKDMRSSLSVLPVLEFLEQQGYIKFFLRPIATKEQFVSDLKRWSSQARYREYEVAFIAMHGSYEALCFDDGDLGLDELAGELDGMLGDRIVYFGSCSTASDDGGGRSRKFRRVLKQFRKKTRARAVCGYVEDVDFAEAAAFEILLFSWLSEFKTRLPAFNRVNTQYDDLSKALGFAVDPPTR